MPCGRAAAAAGRGSGAIVGSWPPRRGPARLGERDPRRAPRPFPQPASPSIQAAGGCRRRRRRWRCRPRARRRRQRGGGGVRARARALIISRCVTVNSVAWGSSIVASTALRLWLCITAPAPRSSYACRGGRRAPTGAVVGWGLQPGARHACPGAASPRLLLQDARTTRPLQGGDENDAGRTALQQHHTTRRRPLRRPARARGGSPPPAPPSAPSERANRTHRHEQRRALAELGRGVGRRPRLRRLEHVAPAVEHVHVGRPHPLLLHARRRHYDRVLARLDGYAAARA
jgi:hypothetical protein